MRSDVEGVFLLVLFEESSEVALGLDGIEESVLVAVVLNVGQSVPGKVGAVVAHALNVGKQVVESNAGLKRTLAGAEAGNVEVLHLLGQTVDHLLERFHAGEELFVPAVQSVVREGDDFVEGVGNHRQMGLCNVGESKVCSLHVLGRRSGGKSLEHD